MTELTEWPHEFYAGVLALDFANTLDARGMDEHEENLHGYADLVRWAACVGALPRDDARDLLRLAEAQPRRAVAEHRKALELREAIYRVFAAGVVGKPPADADLAALVAAHAAATGHARLAPDRSGGFAWTWDADDLASVWWPIAHSAAELATSGPVERVKICASDDGCAGLFLDESKNRSRRWCSMSSCGVDHKIRQQTARRRARSSRAG